MEVLGIILLLGMMGLSVESQSMSPQTFFDVLGQGSNDMDCRPATQEELARAGDLPTGKAATFHLRGFYRCERDVFEYGERNSFVNFVTKNSGQHAKLVARQVKRLRSTSTDKIGVEVDTDQALASIKPYLLTTYETALHETLGADHVLKLSGSLQASDILRIQVRRLDDASSLFRAKIYR